MQKYHLDTFWHNSKSYYQQNIHLNINIGIILLNYLEIAI